jgi:pyruvate kinase
VVCRFFGAEKAVNIPERPHVLKIGQAQEPIKDFEQLFSQLEAICTRAEELEKQFASELSAVHPEFIESARNLVHYIALRHFDMRDLQEQLTNLGLSSLGRAEPHVMASIRAVQRALCEIGGIEDRVSHEEPQSFEESKSQLLGHSKDLLGENPDGRGVEIMVTLPNEAAGNYQLMRDIIVAGAEIARINFAHDKRKEWRKMISNVRRASDEVEKECRIVMDLAGPKVRTGDLKPGPGVVRIRPRRDPLGQVLSPKRVRFVPEGSRWQGKKPFYIPVPLDCIDFAVVGDEIRFKDSRGRKRNFAVIGKDAKGLILESYKQAYVMTGTKLRVVRKDGSESDKFRVGELPATELPIILSVGDILVLNKGKALGEPAKIEDDGATLRPAHVSCRVPEIFSQVSVDEPVYFNDGKIVGTVESVSENEMVIRITKAKTSGSRLRSNRSINFPDSDLRFNGLTATDRRNLEFAVEHADAVGFSFVRSPADVIALQEELSKYPECKLGIIPKIETEEAFRELPRILLATMRSYPAGVMIARGDLAVECGWERLAEIQEEILWLCEAARLPVIWATQVLEGTAKKGRPTRAEITDAAMSQRADCVMLNKGPHIISAIRMLDNILRRMQDHQHKKTAILRKLSITEF